MVEDSLLDIPTVKINDFSTSVEFKPKDKKVRKFRKMTFGCLYFTPPEILANKGYNQKSDVWSVGLLMFFLLTGSMPIKGINNKQTLNNINKKDFKIQELVDKQIIDQEAGNMLSKMLVPEPSNRISAIEAINDPWILKYSKSQAADSSVTAETRQKIAEFWDYYHLQTLCMRYFGIYSLDSLNIEVLK